MRKSAPRIALVCLVLSFLFLLAPTFRQALEVTASSWRLPFSGWRLPDQSLHRLAEQAHQRRDAGALAFVAIRLPPGEQGARLADEAVRLDPRLTWIYVAMVSKNLPDPRVAPWIRRLQEWDTDNAVPHLLEAAQYTVREYPSGGRTWIRPPLENASWLRAMAAAFDAPKYDSYLTRTYQLDCAVIRNYGLGDPLRLVTGESVRSPYMALHPALDYAQGRLIEPAARMEAEGRTAQAARLCWTAAHFGERVQTGAVSESERSTAGSIQIAAYERLQALTEKSGRADESALLKHQVAQLRKYKLPEDMAAVAAYRWYAMVTQASFLILLVAGAILISWGLREALRRRKPTRQAARLDAIARGAGMIAAVLTFACCIAVYLSYRPYAQQFSEFTSGRAFRDFRSLRVFVNFLWMPADAGRLWNGSVIQLYFWWILLTGVVLLLAGVFLSHIVRNPHPAS